MALEILNGPSNWIWSIGVIAFVLPVVNLPYTETDMTKAMKTSILWKWYSSMMSDNAKFLFTSSIESYQETTDMVLQHHWLVDNSMELKVSTMTMTYLDNYMHSSIESG